MLNLKKLIIVACCLILWATSESVAIAQTNSITHPRMLIGERDPLTGYKILRTRYDAGARPPDDIDGWALTYLLTGDETFAKRAVQKIRETHTPDQVGSRTYPEYVKWSLAFDWLYNYPGFDNELKDRVAAELVRAAEKMLEDQSLKAVELAMYHNYTVRYLTLALFALTAVDGHPSVESRAAPLRKHVRQVLDHILDQTNFITPDGGYHESMDYQRITYAPLAMMAELLRTASNSDPVCATPSSITTQTPISTKFCPMARLLVTTTMNFLISNGKSKHLLWIRNQSLQGSVRSMDAQKKWLAGPSEVARPNYPISLGRSECYSTKPGRYNRS
jgi:hypothetical protein